MTVSGIDHRRIARIGDRVAERFYDCNRVVFATGKSSLTLHIIGNRIIEFPSVKNFQTIFCFLDRCFRCPHAACMIGSNFQSCLNRAVIICFKLRIDIRCPPLTGSDHHKIHSGIGHLLPIHDTIITGYIKTLATIARRLHLRNRNHRDCHHHNERCRQNT